MIHLAMPRRNTEFWATQPRSSSTVRGTWSANLKQPTPRTQSRKCRSCWTNDDLRWVCSIERVQNPDFGVVEIPFIASNHDQTMSQRGRGDHAVLDWHRLTTGAQI